MVFQRSLPSKRQTLLLALLLFALIPCACGLGSGIDIPSASDDLADAGDGDGQLTTTGIDSKSPGDRDYGSPTGQGGAGGQGGASPR